jgi:hypothetical protein
MESRIFIQIAFEDDRNARQTSQKLVHHYGMDVLSYLTLTDWRCKFRGGRKNVEGSRRFWRRPDDGVRLRVELAVEAAPNG